MVPWFHVRYSNPYYLVKKSAALFFVHILMRKLVVWELFRAGYENRNESAENEFYKSAKKVSGLDL